MPSSDRRIPSIPGLGVDVDVAVSLVLALLGMLVLGAGLGGGVISGAMLLAGVAPFALGFAHLWHRVLAKEIAQTSSRRQEVDESHGDPLSILEARYAEGKIDDAEFERRLDRLLEIGTARSRDEPESERPESLNLSDQ